MATPAEVQAFLDSLEPQQATVPAAPLPTPAGATDPTATLAFLESLEPTTTQTVLRGLGNFAGAIFNQLLNIPVQARKSVTALEAGAETALAPALEAAGIPADRAALLTEAVSGPLGSLSQLERQARTGKRTAVPDISPEQAQSALLNTAFDLLSVGALKAVPIVAGSAPTFLQRFARGAAVGSLLSGTQEPTGAVEQLEERAIGAALGGTFEGALVPAGAAGLNLLTRGLRAGGQRVGLFKPMTVEALKAEAQHFHQLGESQFLLNFVPMVLRRSLGLLEGVQGLQQDVVRAVAQEQLQAVQVGGRELLGASGKRLAGGARQAVIKGLEQGRTTTLLEPTKSQARGAARVAVARGELNKMIDVATRKVATPELHNFISGELELTMEGLRQLRTLAGKGIGGKQFTQFIDEAVQHGASLRQALAGQAPARMQHMLGLQQALQTFHKSTLKALTSSQHPGLLARWQDIFKQRGNLTTMQMARAFVNNVWVPSLFPALSGLADFMGNSGKLAGELVVRGTQDARDLLLRGQAPARLASVYNSIRNRQVIQPLLRDIKPLLAGAEDVTPGQRLLEVLLVPGAVGKTAVDTVAQRLFGGFSLYDSAYKEAAKRGLSGASREAFVRSWLMKGATPEARLAAMDAAREGAFIVPRSSSFIQVSDNPVMRLLGSPFLKFGVSFAEWLSEWVPLVGLARPVLRAAGKKGGQISMPEFEQALVKQLSGASAIDWFDRTVYNEVQVPEAGQPFLTSEDGTTKRPLSPLMTDLALMTAIARGDMEKAMRLLPSTSITLWSEGLLSDTVSSVLDWNPEQAAKSFDRAVQSMFPGSAVLRAATDLLADHSGGGTTEPFTEDGSFVVGNVLGRGVIPPGAQRRTKVRVGGGPEPSTATLTSPRIPGLPVVSTGVEVPRSLGGSQLVTERQMNNVERVAEELRRGSGEQQSRLFRAGGDLFDRNGNKAPNGELPDVVRRYMNERKQLWLAELVGSLPDTPYWRGLSLAHKEKLVSAMATQAAEMAQHEAQVMFGQQLVSAGLEIKLVEPEEQK